MSKTIALPTRLIAFVSILSLFISSCSVSLISDYDEITDKTITEMQEKTSTVLVQLEDDAGTDNYIFYKPFYQEVKADLNTLSVRANAIDKNQVTIDQIATLSSNFDNMESLHKKKLSKEDIPLIRSGLNRSFTAMIKLQMAKKNKK